MPIFEYACRRCQHRFETIVLSTNERINCPKCASVSVEKQLSVFSSPGATKEAAPSSGGCACTPQTCGCH
ncbi:MAG TPA: zinc ribbon domain-containing protein [Candidatus Binatia bacterium]|nr:zinc ribbon domain-containing protein [Candidatus Binatia bacterium]